MSFLALSDACALPRQQHAGDLTVDLATQARSVLVVWVIHRKLFSIESIVALGYSLTL
jgi:hypothetical protein